MSHLVQNNYAYKRMEFSHCVTNGLNTKRTYYTKTDSTHWSRTVHQNGHKHSETCFVNYFYQDLFCHHNTQHYRTYWKLPCGVAGCDNVKYPIVTDKMYMKPLSKIYMLQFQWNLYQFSPYASFISSGPENSPTWKMHKCIKCIIPQSVVLLYQSFRILGPDLQYYNIWGKNTESNITFLECKIEVTYCYSCDNNYEMSSHLGRVRNGDGRAAEVTQKTLRRTSACVYLLISLMFIRELLPSLHWLSWHKCSTVLYAGANSQFHPNQTINLGNMYVNLMSLSTVWLSLCQFAWNLQSHNQFLLIHPVPNLFNQIQNEENVGPSWYTH